MPELDWVAFLPPLPPYKIGCQNTPYKLGLIMVNQITRIEFVKLTRNSPLLLSSKDCLRPSLVIVCNCG